MVGAAVLAAACSDQTASSPILPGHARLNLAPRFSLVPGGPSIALSRIDAWLIRPEKDSTFQKANFVNESATLTFDVRIDGDSEQVVLDVTGFDANGNEVYHARQPYTIHLGDNSDLGQPEFAYTGADAGVTSLDVAPRGLTLDVGSTTNLTVSGFGEGEVTFSNVNVGWTSRNTNVLTVDPRTGLATGVAKGTTWVVARTATNIADSLYVSVQGFGITPDRAEKLPNGTQQFSVASAKGAVSWTVNGVTGGNATFGTITATGFYTAPASVPTPATFDVCVVQASPSATACASVTINAVPSGSGDVIVFNDDNMFDNDRARDTNNLRFFRNLVDFTGDGARAKQTGVMFHRGHNSGCGGFLDSECMEDSYSTMDSVITAAGYTITNVDTLTATITSIPSTIKTIFLLMPEDTIRPSEINVLKQFAAEGGRIVYVGEREPFLGARGIAVENNFFESMGAVMRNIGGDYACIYSMDEAHLNTKHQTMTGMTGISMACASAVQLGPNDFPLVFDQNDATVVLGAVAKVDLTPLVLENRQPVRPRLDRAASARAADRSRTAGVDRMETGVGRKKTP